MAGNRRVAAKRDTNEPEIIEAYSHIGATVYQLNEKGVPDLLVGFRGVTYLVEVKYGYGKLTEPQEDFIKVWNGQPVLVVYNVDEALRGIGAID